MLLIDATQIRMFLDCREQYRQAYVLNRKPKKPALAREFGIAIHEGVEDFWKGADFATALAGVMEYLNNVSLLGCVPEELRKWDEMVGYAPDMLACYFDNVEYDEDKILHLKPGGIIACDDPKNFIVPEKGPFIEYEWAYGNPFKIDGVTLVGRIDRCEVGPKLIDLKTASEIGKTWKADYKQGMLRDVGLALYDWYLCHIGHAPKMVELEVLLKPYRDKACRMERIPMPEIIAYRSRFEQQLRWVLREMKHYHENYLEADPWPMNSNHACKHKFGACDYLVGCNQGWTPKILDLYGKREEHLNIRKEQLCQIQPQQ